MPSSAPDTIPAVIKLVWKLAPHSILDVGAGNGKYGALFRDYLEERLRVAKDSLPTKRVSRIDAVEGFEKYVGPLHQAVYDNVYVQLIEDFVRGEAFDNYDLIYAGDIIEHLDKKLAIDIVIPALLQKSRMGVLISVPWDVEDQDAVYGNNLERHRSKWTKKDFSSLAPYSYIGRKSNQLLAFLSLNDSVVKDLKGGRFKDWLRNIFSAATDTW
jgi:hypothetical protein